jgi:glycosyltransferase involved in cell wall biosynthesis
MPVTDHEPGPAAPEIAAGLRLSIVVPSFNQGEFLEETLRSLFDQQAIARDELEVIVIDGGSTDDSVAILERHADRLAYYVSEPDEGQTDALVKGFARATGDVLGWLCSDDLLEPTTVREVLDVFTARPESGFVYGDACWIDRQGNFIRWKREIPFNWFIWVYDHNYIPQPSTFWRRDLYERVGGLSREFDLAMDADLWARLARETRPVHVRAAWSRMRFYPEQKNQRLRAESDREDDVIRRRMGYPMDGKLRRRVMFLVAKSARVAWRLWTGCYFRRAGPPIGRRDANPGGINRTSPGLASVSAIERPDNSGV